MKLTKQEEALLVEKVDELVQHTSLKDVLHALEHICDDAGSDETNQLAEDYDTIGDMLCPVMLEAEKRGL